MDTTGKVRLAVANLRAGVEKLQTGDDWQRALDVQARFHTYSFGNCALILSQRPDATRVAGFHTWKKLGRSVKKGEKGIQILAPAGLGRREVEKADGTTDERTWLRFRVAYVFDVSQTEGEPLASFARPLKLDDASFASSVDELRKVALALPGGVVSGIEVRARRAGDPRGAGGWYDLVTRAIVVVTDGASHAQQFKTLVHELAHAILHPVGEHHSAPVREVEAESVAYVVCSALGLDSSSYSFPYVSHWASGADAGKLVQKSGERIAKTARTILEALEAHRPTGDHDAPTSTDEAVAETERAPELVTVAATATARASLAPAVVAYADGLEPDAATLDAERAAKRASNAKRALEAASDLATSATEDGAARVLDARILFGDLLADAANKWIALTVGDVSLRVPRPTLARCAAVLRRRVERVYVDADGLHMRWNAGRGGLNLVSQELPRGEDRVLHVVFPVRAASAAAAARAARQRAGIVRRLGDVHARSACAVRPTGDALASLHGDARDRRPARAGRRPRRARRRERSPRGRRQHPRARSRSLCRRRRARPGAAHRGARADARGVRRVTLSARARRPRVAALVSYRCITNHSINLTRRRT